jgi:hypothetical protein
MSLPESVNILGKEYRVKFCKMAKDHYGETDTDKKVIRINKDKADQGATLTHEVIHAALYESGLTHILHEASEGLEEAIVRAIEHGLSTAGLIVPLEPERPEESEQYE